MIGAVEIFGENPYGTKCTEKLYFDRGLVLLDIKIVILLCRILLTRVILGLYCAAKQSVS